MVMYTVNYAAGAYTLSDTPPVTKTITQVPAGGQTDYFFTSTNIYNATMFALQQPGGEWLGTLFYGRTTIGADGQIGFLPDAQVEGSVGGMSVDAFAANYMAEHGSDLGLRVALFAGDDALIGNGRGGELDGEAGNDVIIGDSRLDQGYQIISGGSGDDIMRVLGDDKSGATINGGSGDDFVFMSGARIDASGGKGIDTFFFDSIVSPNYTDSIAHIKDNDLIQLDPNTFDSLSAGFSSDNFVIGSQAQDADDYLIFRSIKHSYSYLFYDPDGNGPQAQVAIAFFPRGAALTWENIVVSHNTPAAGDSSGANFSLQHEPHAFAVHATGLLP